MKSLSRKKKSEKLVRVYDVVRAVSHMRLRDEIAR